MVLIAGRHVIEVEDEMLDDKTIGMREVGCCMMIVRHARHVSHLVTQGANADGFEDYQPTFFMVDCIWYADHKPGRLS